MKKTQITYTVKPEKVDENIRLIQEVFKQLQNDKINGIKYTCYKVGDNVFTHIVQFENDAANLAFTNMSAFKEFRKAFNDRVIGKAVSNEVSEIGFYFPVEL